MATLLHWITGRGESREAKPVTAFFHEGLRYYVAFDPDFRRLRVFQHLVDGDEGYPATEVSPVD